MTDIWITSICDILTKADRYEVKEEASRKIFFSGSTASTARKPTTVLSKRSPFSV
jgi:hypothetical protein